MNKTKVFAYKGMIGIECDPESDALIAKPGNGNIGCVCDASKIDISEDALKLLRQIKRGRHSLGEIDVYKTNDLVIFGWLGGYLKAFKPHNVETSREYDPSVLKHTENVEIPQQFIDWVDKL